MTKRASRRAFLGKAVGVPIAVAGLSSCAQKRDTEMGQSKSGFTHEIEIAEFTYRPETLQVRRGDKIKWINKDLAPHTATASNKSWDTGNLERNQSAIIEVTDGMDLHYFCRFHPHMRARLRFV